MGYGWVILLNVLEYNKNIIKSIYVKFHKDSFKSELSRVSLTLANWDFSMKTMGYIWSIVMKLIGNKEYIIMDVYVKLQYSFITKRETEERGDLTLPKINKRNTINTYEICANFSTVSPPLSLPLLVYNLVSHFSMVCCIFSFPFSIFSLTVFQLRFCLQAKNCPAVTRLIGQQSVGH